MSKIRVHDVLIIGAGPAGLMCAIAAARPGASIGILEKNESPGRKLLLSGSGRCNITHTGPVTEFLNHYGDAGRFVKPCLYAFTNEDVVRFFADRQIPLIANEFGKLFPQTGSARDLLAAMLAECESNNIAIYARRPVREITATASGFELDAGGERYHARAIVIACGGATYPGTGSTGDGYALARNLGHTIIDIAPALAPVIVRDFDFAECAGISLRDVRIALHGKGNRSRTARGDVLFTHRGLSGPGILDLSRYIMPGDTLAIGMGCFATREDAERYLMDAGASDGKKLARTVLARLDIAERLVQGIFRRHGLSLELRMSQLDKQARRAIADAIAGLRFIIARLGDYSEAMVTRGGVATREVNPRTMESRLLPGLYFAGEVLDVDGDTGGYNIQFALSSGYCAGTGIRTARLERQ